MQRFQLQVAQEEVFVDEEMVAQERFDMNVEEVAVEQVYYDQRVEEQYQVDREIAHDQYQNNRIENEFAENRFIAQEEIQQERRMEQDQLIENAAYNQQIRERNVEVAEVEILETQNNFMPNYQREEAEFVEAEFIQNAENVYIREEVVQNQLYQQEVQNVREGELVRFNQQPQELVEGTRFETPIYYSSFFEWKEGIGSIANAEVSIGQKSLRLNQVGKVKVMKEIAINNSRKIKVTHMTNDILFSIEPEKTYANIPLHYFWFAKLITEKLYLKGCDFSNPYVPQRRFTNTNAINPIIDGILYKQSQYLKSWELRYVAINSEGLLSYKGENGGESFSIKKDTATELWTRFDIHEKMLVIKIHHSGRKTQFGIPIVDYCRESEINWLYAFYRLVYPY